MSSGHAIGTTLWWLKHANSMHQIWDWPLGVCQLDVPETQGSTICIMFMPHNILPNVMRAKGPCCSMLNSCNNGRYNLLMPDKAMLMHIWLLWIFQLSEDVSLLGNDNTSKLTLILFVCCTNPYPKTDFSFHCLLY